MRNLWGALKNLGFFLFLAGLAAFGKAFSYCAIWIHEKPLFVGEIALAGMLVWTWTRRRVWNPLAPPARIAIGAIGVYLGMGALELVRGLIWHRDEFGLVQILRDSALHYQALWVWVGAMATPKILRRDFTAIALGVLFAQLVGWQQFLMLGDISLWTVIYIGAIPGNEVVNPLLPLAFLIWPAWAMIPIAASMGHLILGQVFIYLKKNWLVSYAFLAFPAALWGPSPVARSVQRLRAVAIGLGVGIVLAYAATYYVVTRSQDLREPTLAGRISAVIRFAVPMYGDKTDDRSAVVEPTTSGASKKISGKRDSDFPLVLSPPVAGDEKPGFISWRKALWRQAWTGFLERPWVGQGLGPHVVRNMPYGYGYLAVHENRWISGPHNSFLTILFRSGFFAGLALVIAVGLAYASAIVDFFRRPSPERLIAIVSFTSVLFYALFNVCLENPQAGTWFWLFLGWMLSSSVADSQSGSNS